MKSPAPVLVLMGLLPACAGAPPVVPAPTLPALRGIVVDGPPLAVDWAATLRRFEGAHAHVHTLGDVEATVAAAYEWADWREVQAISAPEPEADGLLRVSVWAEPPPDGDTPPTPLAWPPADPVPAPTAAAGARAEAALDAALQIWKDSPSRVLIDGGERRLYFKRGDGQVISYPVAVGTARTPTPAGEYTVEGVRHKPTWYPPASIRREYAAKGKVLPTSVPPGAGNPLGDWFIRLQNGIGIHGTNQPRSIGRAASHGCVRMHDSDVRELAAQLKTGDGVTVVQARSALIASQ